MNRNGRRIALGLIAIVLGAGFLLKVIPPATDVGIDEGGLINIDGSLVTSPLDLKEIQETAHLQNLPNDFMLGTASQGSSLSPIPPATTSVLSSVPSDNPPPAIVLGGSPAGQEDEPEAPHNTGSPPDGYFPASQPPALGVIVPPMGDGDSNFPSTPGGGNSNPRAPSSPPLPNGNGNEESPYLPDPLPSPRDPEQLPPEIISLPDAATPPLDPDDFGKEPLPDVTFPGSKPDSSTDRDVPTHQVPDGGSTVGLIVAALAALSAAGRRRRLV